MASKQRRKPPSRIKYEKENPTVSARLPVEVRGKLLAKLKTLDMRLADALKVIAGELEIKAVPIEEAKKASYEEAKKRYMVTYLCRVCGKYMTEHGWGHAECHKQVNKS